MRPIDLCDKCSNGIVTFSVEVFSNWGSTVHQTLILNPKCVLYWHHIWTKILLLHKAIVQFAKGIRDTRKKSISTGIALIICLDYYWLVWSVINKCLNCSNCFPTPRINENFPCEATSELVHKRIYWIRTNLRNILASNVFPSIRNGIF